ncbi:MAG: hypothetical protein NXH85_02695 [Pseudomonadaceae bacterium]|nr:hypothetical protein [Pseudomonadaceae bacterium]
MTTQTNQPRSSSVALSAWMQRLLLCLCIVVLQACQPAALSSTSADAAPSDIIDAIAADFVINGLGLYQHDATTHLYIGPPEFKAAADARNASLPEVIGTFAELQRRLSSLSPVDADTDRRIKNLQDRIVALETRAQLVSGETLSSFDEETRLVFGIEVPHQNEAHFQALIDELDTLVEGEGPLAERIEAWREQFVIPPEKLETVISTAMAECRRRTLEHFELPENERVSLHIATNQPWVGFTFYRGDGHSEIHLNADVPVHIERAIELGCHEGYPGHHVHATLLEEHLIKGKGWIEYSLITLAGPLAVITEGAASHTVDMVFTQPESLAFERDVLMPLAGLNSGELERYYRYIELLEALNYARNETARQFLYGGMSREDAIEWLMTYGLETRGTASQRLDFITALRSYVVTYNEGRRLVREHIERVAGNDRDAQWQAFREVILRPILPREMIAE